MFKVQRGELGVTPELSISPVTVSVGLEPQAPSQQPAEGRGLRGPPGSARSPVEEDRHTDSCNSRERVL